jgi:hypothetical protein
MADDIDDLLHGILSALEVDTPKIRKKLRQALEQGLDLAFQEPGVDVEIHVDVDASDGEEPDVTVLDGGRKACDPMSAPGEPDLHVVDGDGGVNVEVRRPSAPRGRRARGEGEILVVDQEQAVYAGLGARVTRVRCLEGAFDVLAEGTRIGTLRAGQSVDVETAALSVRGTGQGTYRAV